MCGNGFYLFLYFQDRVSLYSHDCPKTSSIEQAGLKLVDICIALPPECWVYGVGHYHLTREWVLRVWDNGGRHMKLDQAEVTDMGPLMEILGLIKTLPPQLKKVSKVFLNGWLKHLSKDGPLTRSWRCWYPWA